jgi:divalent metal cation (Fe/Co/Zn/Cd) transporter
LEAAHRIAHRVEEAMQQEVPSVTDVVVHAEPIHHEPRLDETHSSSEDR